MKNKRVYPEWFINELVNEEDKEKAMDGSLKSTEKVEFKCDKGHMYEQSISHHIKLSTGKKLQGCPICGKVKNHRNRMNTISSKRVYPQWFIDELVNEEDKEKAMGGSLMNKSKVEFKCNKGHIYEQVVGYHIKTSTGERNKGCPICGKVKNYKNRMNTISSKRVYPQWFIDELVNEEDKEKARDGSLRNNSRIEFRCDKGHIYNQSVDHHIKLSTGKKLQGCPICGKINRENNKIKTISSKRVYPEWFIDELVNEEDKEKARDGSLMNHSKIKFECDKGHIYEQIVYNHIRLSTGERIKGCPVCTHIRSKPELEIEEYVKSLEYNTEHKKFRESNNRLFEIDIFIPERNVGIEYCGSYYHASENGYKDLDKEYHFTKYSECRKKNILLITIFDIEWEQKEYKIKQYIKDILERKENKLSYNRDGYMNNNYPSWKYYHSSNKSNYIEDYYIYQNKYKVYTCGYTKLE